MTAARGRHAGAGGLLLVAAALLAACGSPAATPSPTPAPTPAPTDSPSAAPSDSGGPGTSAAVIPDSPVAGIITAVDSSGLDQVKGFTVRTNDGSTVTFLLGQLDNGDEFPPGHLKEHQAAGAPVLIFFKPDANGNLVVYHIEDAP